jgi:hypothetical protein
MARTWKNVRAQAVDAGLIDEARVSELRAEVRAPVGGDPAGVRAGPGRARAAAGGVAVADLPD